MLARPRPGALGDRVRARVEASEALINIGDKPEPPHLAIGGDIDAALGLPSHDFCDCALHARRKRGCIEIPAPLLRLDHLQQIRRPRQASDMCRENSLNALFHEIPPRLHEASLRAGVDQVSTVRSAVIDGMKKYAAAVNSTNCFGIVSVVRRLPAG